MTRLARFFIVLTGLSLLGDARAGATPADTGDSANTEGATPATDTAEAPPAAEPADAVPAVTATRAAAPKVSEVLYGVGLRGRVVSVPGWMLGLFTKNNVPLLTLGHVGLELFRRHRNFQVAISFSYQNMSPANGNWLGDGKDAATDTAYVQFKDFSLYTADISFIWNNMFTDWFGMHYGAGIGAGIVHGSIQHNDSVGCTDSNVGDLSQCHPALVMCANGVCTPDSALAPTRKKYPDVPSAVPIVNVVLGLDFRVPSIRGWEAKIEGGFYDAFFFGGGVAYTF
jgi:hypothetical protein